VNAVERAGADMDSTNLLGPLQEVLSKESDRSKVIFTLTDGEHNCNGKTWLIRY